MTLTCAAQQTLNIISGYILSLLSQMGKSTFYKHLFHYASFITSGEVECTLAEVHDTRTKNGNAVDRVPAEST